MSRGGKEQKQLSPEVQQNIQLVVLKNELDNWKKFGNQLLDMVKLSDPDRLYWINEYPNEIKQEHLVHLLNVTRGMVK